MWVLIITLIYFDVGGVTQVAGFSSEQQCNDEAVKFVQKQKEYAKSHITTACLWAPQLK